MGANHQTNKEFKEYRIRQWVDFTVAPLARWVWTDPNSFDLTFGGVAADGNYSTTINFVRPNTTPLVITTVRAAAVPATNTDLATQHAADINAAIAATPAGSLDPYELVRTFLQSASSAAAVVSVIAQPSEAGARPFTITTAAPGAATLVVTPDDTFPITFDTLGFGPRLMARTQLEITVIPVDIDGIPVDPNGSTNDMTVYRVIDRGAREQTTDVPSTPVGVTRTVATTAHPMGEAFRIKAGGGRYGFNVGVLVGGPPPALHHLEIWAREVTD